MSPISLKIFNFPPIFSSVDVREFLHLFGLETTRLIKRRNTNGAIVCVDNESEARLVISRLHQLLIKTHRLKVEYTNQGEESSSAELQSSPLADKVTKSKSLVTVAEKCFTLGYEGFPPPHLAYRYPKCSPEVLQNIARELAGNTAFYYQTLHLMNKMNLQPPFERRQDTITTTPAAEEQQSQATVSDEESELESDSEMHEPGKPKSAYSQVMRTMKVVNYEASSRESQSVQRPALKKTKMEIHISGSSLAPPAVGSMSDDVSPEQQPTEIAPQIEEASPLPSIDDILRNRIPEEQRSTLNVFQNYSRGDPTTKLYIKNLSKQVTEQELEELFGIFFNANLLKGMEIKLMKTGRMKGQAFVTFVPVEDATEGEPLNEKFKNCIDQALATVNGYILKDKPIVVSYGKSV
ncbi:U11/U12 small nuclear ribonucleoprotein 65 kDa protein [Anopheles arabiensis]|uniref:U11/U12 small nuclear ribonucleoprotein 65 kDa protein n=1 Tax=Anopheles arabiensis TaxID=7173 RepID=UPI001AAD7E91|nr:U11/U12 small nuclear ribonucleoprotein 65 kDa protein [Anopheles arabiensis]